MKGSRPASATATARDGRRNSKNPTIFDVAAVAGVSKSTVSNVVRGADDVAEATRERVLEAIRRLNYKPNAIARQFVRQRTTILGVLVGDLDNPYYAQMARVVEREAFRCGYTAMFCNIEGEEEIAVAGVDALLEHRIAGVVFLAFISRTPQLEEALRRAEVPIVFLGLSEQWGDSVGPEDAAGARLAVEHLLSLGHSRVAYVRTPLVEQSGDRARYSGYRAAMRQARLPTKAPVAWTPGSDTVVIGRRRLGLRDALTGDQRPTGLFVSNDIGAISMIEACEQIGIAVPADLSIVGFDDIAIAALHRISLTTIAQPLDYQAERAVSLLLERIEKPRLRPRHVSAPVELRVRGSTAPPSA
ncbi:MAG TPA: LacI family DNA-binding transcriptional regulator [Solirubrobacteraceae bacterium]|nr:LacI family DNA-binding transcriptional regulator [Solirubrobacteraceae bacterium]